MTKNGADPSSDSDSGWTPTVGPVAGSASGADSGPVSNPTGGKPKAKHRAVVRLSRVDQLRLEAGEIDDPYQAVGKPEPLSQVDADDSRAQNKAEKGHDAWLRQNVPPHW
ncbi:MAG: hypothetical protein WAS54_00910 [Scrofimicrobium sp.]